MVINWVYVGSKPHTMVPPGFFVRTKSVCLKKTLLSRSYATELVARTTSEPPPQLSCGAYEYPPPFLRRAI